MNYTVVEKTTKQDGSGSMFYGVWLQSEDGAYSLLRPDREALEALK